MSEFWAVILAAGESKRMKVPKMLLPFNGKTMIETVVENVINSDINNTIVVLGSYYEEIQKVLNGYPLIACYNEDYKNGMFSSVKCGLKNLPEKFEAVMIFPGDQPFIGTDVINQMITICKKSKNRILIPVYKKKRGHPLLIPFKYRNILDQFDGREGLRSLIAKYPGEVIEVETNSNGILKDFDTKEDYLNEINQII